MSVFPAQDLRDRLTRPDEHQIDKERIELDLRNPSASRGYWIQKGSFAGYTFAGNWSKDSGLGMMFADSLGRIWREDRNYLTMIFDPRSR